MASLYTDLMAKVNLNFTLVASFVLKIACSRAPECIFCLLPPSTHCAILQVLLLVTVVHNHCIPFTAAPLTTHTPTHTYTAHFELLYIINKVRVTNVC